jgi:hypothetical protein
VCSAGLSGFRNQVFFERYSEDQPRGPSASFEVLNEARKRVAALSEYWSGHAIPVGVMLFQRLHQDDFCSMVFPDQHARRIGEVVHEHPANVGVDGGK